MSNFKDYIFTFESGGFNTVTAKTLDEAKKKVQETFGSHPRLSPKMDTVKEVTQKELDSWYRFFD